MRDEKREDAAGRLGKPNEFLGTNISFHLAERLEDIQVTAEQARKLIRTSALNPRRFQIFQVASSDGRDHALIRIQNAPAGRILLHPEDASSHLASALGATLERLGCLHKLGIASEPFMENVKSPWLGGGAR